MSFNLVRDESTAILMYEDFNVCIGKTDPLRLCTRSTQDTRVHECACLVIGTDEDGVWHSRRQRSEHIPLLEGPSWGTVQVHKVVFTMRLTRKRSHDDKYTVRISSSIMCILLTG